MKKLYTFNLSERAVAAMFREMLRREGIACLVRNEQLFAGMGEIPFTECYPELWVIDDDLFPRASSLLAQYMRSDDEGLPGWTCRDCGEPVEGQFNACWNCNAPRGDD